MLQEEARIWVPQFHGQSLSQYNISAATRTGAPPPAMDHTLQRQPLLGRKPDSP